MATITVSSDANIDDITWASGDLIDITNNATLTISTPQSKQFYGITITRGLLYLENTSTTQGIVLEFTNNYKLKGTPEGQIIINGNLIPIHTSDGTANQTFSHWDRAGSTITTSFPALFVENDYGMFNRTTYGSTANTLADTRLFSWDDTNKVYTLDGYVPPNGTKILAPNIIIGKANNDTHLSFNFSNTKNTSIKGCWLNTYFYVKNIDTVTLEKSLVNTFDSCKNVIATNMIFMNLNKMSYISKFIGNNNYYGDNYKFSAIDDIEDTAPMYDGIRLTDSYRIFFEYCDKIVLNNPIINYCDFDFSVCKNIKVNNPSYKFSADYYSVNALNTFNYCTDAIVSNLKLNTDFVLNNTSLCYFNNRNTNCKLIDTTIDCANNTNAGKYVYAYVATESNTHCGAYNVIFNNDSTSGYPVKIEDTKQVECFLVKSKFGNRPLRVGGTRPIILGVETKKQTYPTLNNRSASFCNIIDVADTTKGYIYAVAGDEDGETIVTSGDVLINSYSHQAFLKTQGSYIILKNTEDTAFKQIGAIDTSVYLKKGGNVTVTYSIDKGITWDDIANINTETDLTYLWVKAVADDTNGYSTYFSYATIGYTVDTSKLDYDGVFTWDLKQLTITGLLSGSIVSIYDNEIVDNGNNNTLLATTTNSGTTFNYTHDSNTNEVRVQVIKDGYIEIMQDFTIKGVNQTLSITQEIDTN